MPGVGLTNHPPRVGWPILVEECGRAVGRSVVDDDHLELAHQTGLPLQRVEAGPKLIGAIVRRDHDAHRRPTDVARADHADVHLSPWRHVRHPFSLPSSGGEEREPKIVGIRLFGFSYDGGLSLPR